MARHHDQPEGPAHEAIRVVALHQPKVRLRLADQPSELWPQAAERSAEHMQLEYNGGPLVANAEVFVIYWGQHFVDGSLKTYPDRLNAFFDTILQSPMIDQLSEYSTDEITIGRGRRSGSAIIESLAPTAHISDSALRKQLKKWIETRKDFPKPSANTIYFIYLQQHVSVSMGGARSCSSFCGYHDAIDDTIFYAIMPFPSCSGCLGDMLPFDALCGTSSHELCEAITDPVPGTGWYNMEYGEVGDICGWKFKSYQNYVVQKEWSNKAGKCI